MIILDMGTQFELLNSFWHISIRDYLDSVFKLFVHKVVFLYYRGIYTMNPCVSKYEF